MLGAYQTHQGVPRYHSNWAYILKANAFGTYLGNKGIKCLINFQVGNVGGWNLRWIAAIYIGDMGQLRYSSRGTKMTKT